MNNRLSSMKVLMYTIVGGTLILGAVGQANAVVISATERGAYRGDTFVFGTGASGFSIGNYLTGFLAGREFRSFFNFDLSSITGTITSASFIISPASFSFGSSPTTIETLGIFDVTSSIALLIVGAGGPTAFADLGGGLLYGSASSPTGTPAMVMTIDFNASGLADLNAAIGTDFAIGGALTSLSGSGVSEFLFGASACGCALTQLDLQITTKIPEPSTLALYLVGLAGLGFMMRRRRTGVGKTRHAS